MSFFQALLFDLLERLPWEKKYLGANIGYVAPLKDNQHLP